MSCILDDGFHSRVWAPCKLRLSRSETYSTRDTHMSLKGKKLEMIPVIGTHIRMVSKLTKIMLSIEKIMCRRH